ncbi:MAG: hypothetical protein A2Y61_03930 [Chloroflexi bacterium RBG_13_60_13]|nr:MAG: hypothetical protein A2Y61_03930 [Chloroflexi bacterium RBG_13_60_13]
MAQVKALDVSSHSGPVPVEKWRVAQDDGVRLAIVQAWGGLPDGSMGPNPYCRQQLLGAREAGLLTAIYVWIPPDTTTDTSVLMQVAKDAAGDEYQHVSFVALDIEDPQHRPLHPTLPEQRLENAIGHVRDKTAVIYTSRSMWPDLMKGWESFAWLPLWDASYAQGDQLDVNFRPYGSWTQRAALQYEGSGTRYGIWSCADVVDLVRLGIEEEPEPAENPYPLSLALLVKRFANITDAFPLEQDEKDDPAREAKEIVAWQDLYDQEVAWRRSWFGRE